MAPAGGDYLQYGHLIYIRVFTWGGRAMLLMKLLPGKAIITEVWFLFRCICLHGGPATAGCRPLLHADAAPTGDGGS